MLEIQVLSNPSQNRPILALAKDPVVALCKKIFEQIALFYLIVATTISRVWIRNRQISQLDSKIANMGADQPIQTLYYKQLKNLLASQCFTDSPAALLREVDETDQKLKDLVNKTYIEVSSLIHVLEGGAKMEEHLPIADALYSQTMKDFEELSKKALTPVQKALYSGKLTTIFRDLDDAFSKRAHQMLHRYCGCHVETKQSLLELKKLAPTLKPNFERGNYEKYRLSGDNLEVSSEMPYSATLLSQSLGGGHNVVQEAMGCRISRDGGHVYKVEADLEVLEEFYQFKKWTGKTGAEWSQYLLQGSYFRTIRFLGWLSSSTKRGDINGLVQLFAQSMLARGRQDFSMTLFTRQAKAAEEAAYYVGQGLLDVATDLDYQVFGFDEGSTNPHFKHLLMVRDEVEERNLPAKLRPEQIIDGGFPVRDPFLKAYSEDELREFKKQYGLESDARLVLVLCGGEGIQNNCAEEIFATYPKEGPKMHLVTICGNNKTKQKKLEKLFAKPSHVTATALGWTDAETLGKFYAIAKQEGGLLVSAKAGGGTVSEGMARQVPMLVSDRTKMIYHERKNLEFLEKQGAGTTFTREIELPKKVLEKLQGASERKEREPANAVEKSIRVIRQEVQECRESTKLVANAVRIYWGLPKAQEELTV